MKYLVDPKELVQCEAKEGDIPMVLGSNQAISFQSLNEVVDVMTEKLLTLQKNGDHRVVFLHVYLIMTKEMQRRISSGFFLDPDWIERVLIGFAHYYFNAIEANEAGQPCPPAWELAFQFATKKRGFVLQDALLGINAHINNDLPMALYLILKEDRAWPDARIMLRRRQDHDRINDVLHDLVDIAQDALANYYDRFIRIIDFLMGRRDEELSSFILAYCRTNVWHDTELLLDASDDDQRSIQLKRIENNAYTMGLKIANSHAFPKFMASFARKKQLF
ncbi:DUF5995 family protein [Neobacillus cucumis]|uniref:DUF5995 family protein n=1 Tax=Neobacillus cucumis TaxID=1740721 RepID=UPI002852FDDC|nr:DUF5995 family protein [Neobacillus cucumis]MDR4950457.1 DUF5995 family protein [Neobacillus cucumis]